MSNFNFQQVADTIADNNTDRQTASNVGQFMATALQVYQQHLQQQKLDTIANTLMAAQNTQNDQSYAVANAKPATAVQADDPDLEGSPQYNPAGGNVYQYTDGASPGDPPTDSQMAAHNADLGYSYNENPTLPSAPGDMPATGGYAALQMRMAMQARQNQNALLTARMQNYGTRQQDWQTNQNRLTANANQRQTDFNTNQNRLTSTYGPGGQRGPQPQADTLQKLQSDVQTKYGVGISDLQNAGDDDIVQQPNGDVLYRLGGGTRANGTVIPKTQVVMSKADHDVFLQRYSAIASGNPMIINQPQMSAVQTYQNALNRGANPNGGATPPGAAAMQQAQNIKAQVQAGNLSQADGITQLQALGFN